MTVDRRTLLLAGAAVAAGVAIVFVDSRPNWDDTGITAVALIFAAALVAFLGRRQPWLWALLVGAWVPALEIGGRSGSGSLLALVFAGIGAGVGYALARAQRPDPRLSDHP